MAAIGGGRSGGPQNSKPAAGTPLTTAVALLYVLLWSSAFIASRVGVQHSPPLSLLCGALPRRGTGAGRDRDGAPAADAARPPRLGAGWPSSGCSTPGCTWGSPTRGSATSPPAWARLSPRSTRCCSPCWRRACCGERLSGRKLLGLALGFGGVVFVMGARLGSGGKTDTAGGMSLAVVGVVCLVGATIIYKRYPPTRAPTGGQRGAAGGGRAGRCCRRCWWSTRSACNWTRRWSGRRST